MSNKKKLIEKELFESQRKRMMQLAEYSYNPVSSMVEEDGEDDNMQNQDMPLPPDAQGQGGAPQGNPNGGPSMPPMDGGQDGGQGGAPMNPNAQGDVPPMGDEQGEGLMGPDGGDMDMPPMDDENAEGEDEEVIDVDDLTKAQEKVNDKVNSVGRNLGKVDDRIENLLKSLDKVETMIDKQNIEIDDLKKELIKRNPTQTERLNLRSLDSYPFNVSPSDYFKKLSKENDNYEIYGDNDEPTAKEYRLTKDDIDDYNEADIAKSFDINDDLDQNINKIFGV